MKLVVETDVGTKGNEGSIDKGMSLKLVVRRILEDRVLLNENG